MKATIGHTTAHCERGQRNGDVQPAAGFESHGCGDGARTGEHGNPQGGDRHAELRIFAICHVSVTWLVRTRAGALEHLVADDEKDDTARDPQRRQRDAENLEYKVPGKTHGHDMPKATARLRTA